MKPPNYEAYLAEIEQFIATPQHYVRPSWLYSQDRVLSIYLRVKPRNIEHQMLWGVDIANIEVDRNWQQKGHGTQLIETIHAFNPHAFTYVELVHHPRLQNWLKRSGWIWDKQLNEPSYYRLTSSPNPILPLQHQSGV